MVATDSDRTAFGLGRRRARWTGSFDPGRV